MYLRPAVVDADVLEARGIFPLAAIGAAAASAVGAAASVATAITGPALVGGAVAYGATKAARVVGPALVNAQLRGAMRALLLNGLPSFMKFSGDD